MDWFKINGKAYNVIVTSLEENFNILYSENTGRTLAQGAPMILDALGTFFGHTVEVRRIAGKEEEFDELYRLVSRPINDGFDIDIVHCQDVANYMGYISNGKRGLKRIDNNTGKVYWDALTLNIIPMKAQVTPSDEEPSYSIW
jgi:hypothetical protein